MDFKKVGQKEKKKKRERWRKKERVVETEEKEKAAAEVEKGRKGADAERKRGLKQRIFSAFIFFSIFSEKIMVNSFVLDLIFSMN